MFKNGAWGVEWPTLFMFVVTYTSWFAGTMLWEVSPLAAIGILSLAIAQFSSLQHEVLHGHPFASKSVNEAMVFPALTLVVPYNRFRDLHLAHHFDPNLTDPYDDPEANFVDPAVWATLSPFRQGLLRLNNTLFGRIFLGPILGTFRFVASDWRLIRANEPGVAKAWILNGVGVGMVLLWLNTFGNVPLLGYCLAAYFAYGLLKIRTFLEHRAHDACRARSVVIESRGPLSLLFLNNSFHVVHHSSPNLPWYKLPALYAEKREYYLRRNDGYMYRSYTEIFRKYLFRAKDPVPHPIWPVAKTGSEQP
jgi:fatty acid desaturase